MSTADAPPGKRKKQWKTPDSKAARVVEAPSLASLKGQSAVLVVSQRGKERSAAREVIGLLDHATPADAPLPGKDVPISQQIAQNVAAAAKQEPTVIETNCDCLVFISSEVDPVAPVTALFERLVAKGSPCCRYVEKILPLQRVCHASLEAIKAQVQELLAQRTAPLPGSFAVVLRVRSAGPMDKLALIDALASLVDQRQCKVDLSSPELVILVEALQNIAGCSILDGGLYKKYAKLKCVACSRAVGRLRRGCAC